MEFVAQLCIKIKTFNQVNRKRLKIQKKKKNWNNWNFVLLLPENDSVLKVA